MKVEYVNQAGHKNKFRPIKIILETKLEQGDLQRLLIYYTEYNFAHFLNNKLNKLIEE